ncbi:MAG: hypothetical protein ACQCXQ_14300 [Verrucomicrobiales bacterium]|nr:hypothetical protein [Verrucomicrobiota bacterium JB025]
MKNALTIALAAVFAMSFSAVAENASKKKGAAAVTEEEFVAKSKIRFEKSGKEFKEEAARAAFKKMDADGDGKLTKEERKAFQKQSKKAKTPKKNKAE